MKPSEKQFQKILQYLPSDLEIPTIDEFEVIRFIATDNLLTRNFAKWGIDELNVLAQKLPGCNFTLDHDWDFVHKAQGLIIDSYVQELKPESSVIDAAGNGKENRKIIKTEGYKATIVEVAFPSFGDVLSGLRFGIVRFVSLGGFLFEDRVCPLCKVSFEDTKCKHIIPDLFWGALPNTTTPDGLKVAPYYIRTNVRDVGELSLVLIPNVPGAKVLLASNI